MSQTPQLLLLAPASLKSNPWNTNVVSPDNEAKLEESIRRRGMFKPIVVRELDDGSFQILGGEHRNQIAARIGIKLVPVFSVGKIDEKAAQEIGLLDNSRYGDDDALQLAELMEGLGNADELATFMPYTEADIASIFSSVNIALDSLDLSPSDEEPPTLPTEKPIQTHQIIRFKVPVDDVANITELVERTMKEQKFTEEDSLANAGDALVYLFNKVRGD